eukprot:TRINITY_DN1123_c0_g2_i1.p1 TRINITY_DN1123_c0_g2~~TRINITY_DN1123_c0_g2_i1.p1  ORF type:complete len:229 (-),score=38.92 TRINITY_DN1123_c0_g2_i1:309-995(-)
MGGRGRDSRSPSRRRGGGGRGRDSKSRSRSRGRGGGRDRRDSRDRGRGRGRSPPRRRDSRDRGGRGGPPPKRFPPSTRPRYEPPPASKPELKDEHKQKAIEFQGTYYATIDFTPPQTVTQESYDVPKGYDRKHETDASILQWNRPPPGWVVCPSLDEEAVANVVKLYPWGTHLLVLDDGKSYQTAGGPRPGTCELIWEGEKGPRGRRLQRLGGSQAFWHGKYFICFKP